MEVNRVIELKENLEADILNLIERFENMTTTTVAAINHHSVNVTALHHSRVCIRTVSVGVEVRL